MRVLNLKLSSTLFSHHLKERPSGVRMDKSDNATNEHRLPFLRLTPETAATNKPVDTSVEGEIPTWIQGSLYRNGPGIYTLGLSKLKHLFDGFCTLHRFDIHSGRVTYMSRILDTDTWQQSVKANRLLATQFATYETPDPCKSMFARFMTYFKIGPPKEFTDNVAVNIVEHGDTLYAMTETPWMVKVDPKSLLKTGRENLSTIIAAHVSTAHPHFGENGSMYNLGTAMGPTNFYKIVEIPPSAADAKLEQAKLLCSLKSGWKNSIGYNHSFGMSRDYFVILEQPIVMDSLKFLITRIREKAPYDNYSKHPNVELIFRLVRREDNTEVKIKYHAAPTFTFHFVNCFEDGDHLVVDFCGYSDLSIIDQLYLDYLDKHESLSAAPIFRRYVLPLKVDKTLVDKNLVTLPKTRATATLRPDGTVYLEPDLIVEDKNGIFMELPRINYGRANGKKYRYVYGTALFSADPKLVKMDVVNRTVKEWKEEGYIPGEPVFVPNPQPPEDNTEDLEDHGVILSPVLGSKDDLPCFLLILDAKTFQEKARAKVPPHVKMAISFHGSFMKETSPALQSKQVSV